MKYIAPLFVATLASAAAFSPFGTKASVPAPAQKEAKKSGTFFDNVFGMDLFAPNPTVNEYGARNKKKLVTGKIQQGKSYVPAGLTASQYSQIRKDQAAKKAANYQKNVKKAGKFQDYTDFYLKRGTDISSGWKKSVTLGHTMAKTKYDWSGDKDKKLWAKTK